MAVKKKNLKKKKARESYEKAVKIKCCYCDANESCDKKAYKENSEEFGFKTYCTLTPNIPRKHKKKKICLNEYFRVFIKGGLANDRVY